MDLEIDNKRNILSKESYFQKIFSILIFKQKMILPPLQNVVIMMMKIPVKVKMAIIR